MPDLQVLPLDFLDLLVQEHHLWLVIRGVLDFEVAEFLQVFFEEVYQQSEDEKAEVDKVLFELELMI